MAQGSKDQGDTSNRGSTLMNADTQRQSADKSGQASGGQTAKAPDRAADTGRKPGEHSPAASGGTGGAGTPGAKERSDSGPVASQGGSGTHGSVERTDSGPARGQVSGSHAGNEPGRTSDTDRKSGQPGQGGGGSGGR